MLITTGIAYYVGKKEIESSLEEKLHVVNHLKIERIDNLFSEVDILVDELHDDGIVETYIDSLLICSKQDSLKKNIKQIKKRILENISYRNEPSIIKNVKVVTLDGKVLFEEKKSKLTQSKSEKNFLNPQSKHFPKAFNHSIYSSVVYNEYSDEFFMYSLSPLHYHGNTQALLLVQLHMEQIYNAISDTTGLGHTGETILCEFKNDLIHFISPLKYDSKNFLERDINKESGFGTAAIRSITDKEGFISKTRDYNKIKVDAAWNYYPKLNWGIYSKINHEESFRSIYRLKKQLILIAISLVFASIFLAYLLTREILKPIGKIKKSMIKLANGEFPDKIYYQKNDELSSTITNMNKLVKRLKKSTELAQDIGSRKFNSNLTFEKTNDVLSRALFDMRENLQKIEEKNKKQKWENQGLTQIAEIIRTSSDNFENLSSKIISHITRYIEGVYGAIYIRKTSFTESLKQDDPKENYYYELVSGYANSRSTEDKKSFRPGQGLIGESAVQKKIINVKNIDLEFSKISSGLGESQHGSILIVPLVINEETLGVIEIATFTEINEHQEKFIKKIGENIASSILATQARDKKNHSLKQSELIIKELKAKQTDLIKIKKEQNLKELNLVLEIEELKNQIEELKRELNFKK